MFLRLAEQYRSVVQDLVMSLQALASSLKKEGITATCYVCDDGDGRNGSGASFMAELGDQLGQAVGHRQPWRHPPGPREGVAVDDAVLPSQGADETWWLPRPVHPQREV